MSMIKVTYSNDISSTVGVGGEIVKSASEMQKQAATIFNMEYEALKPPKGMTGIHLVALGDAEAYPMNRNGDLFPKEACEKYVDTFVKHGHVYEHHRNKDPRKALGQIKAAAYNPDMHRIELYIWADNEKSRDHLERLEKTGEVSFSMAAHVPNDRCFTKGTLVLTSDGFKPIETIKVGDRAITAEANERVVTATMVNDSDFLTRVSVRGIPEEIECTPNHPFNVVSCDKMRSCLGSANGMKRRHTPKDCTAKCAVCKRIIDVSSDWIRADELKQGDYIKQKIDASASSVTRGLSFAYLCGMYVGDGFPIWQVSGHGKAGDTESIQGISVSASISENDTCILERIKQAFLSCTGKSATVTEEAGDKRAVVVHLHDSLLANRIVSLVGSYSRGKFISSEILGWSKPEKEAFIAGYLDADGHIGVRANKNVIRICSVNKGLLLSVQRIMWSIGIPATVGIGNKLENMKDVSGFTHKSSTYHVFFNKAPRSLVEKSAKLTRDYDEAKAGNHCVNVVIMDGYAYLPVASSRTFKSDKVAVYNFEVEGEHTYIAEGVGVHNCSYCGAIRERPGDPNECDHVKYQLGKIAEDGRQIGTYNDHPQWFDISFVGRPADRIAWNLKVASDMSEDIRLSSVKQAEIEGYVLPDDLAIESDSSKRKHCIMQKLADAYEKLNSWIFGDAKPSGHDTYTFELRKLAGASIDDASIARLRELNPADAFAALGDAGIVMDAGTFFKYAFGPDYGKVEKYASQVSRMVPGIICEAVKSASCAEFCNASMYDATKNGILYKPVPFDLKASLFKSAAARCFGMDDAVANVIDAVAGGTAPAFSKGNEKVADGEVKSVAEKLARRYAMYKLAGLCAALDGACGIGLKEDDVIMVAAAQDMKD